MLALFSLSEDSKIRLGLTFLFFEKGKIVGCLVVQLFVIWLAVNYIIAGAYEPPEGRRRSVRLRVRCVRRSSLAMLDLIWSGQLQGISKLHSDSTARSTQSTTTLQTKSIS